MRWNRHQEIASWSEERMYIAEGLSIIGQVFQHIKHPYDIKWSGERRLAQISLKKSATCAFSGMPEAFCPPINTDDRGSRAGLGEKPQYVPSAASHLKNVALGRPPRYRLACQFEQQFIAADKPKMPVFY